MHGIDTIDGNVRIDSANVGLEKSVTGGISIYPNPCSGLLYVSIPDVRGDEIIRLYNMNGEKVLERRLRSGNLLQTIDLTSFESGLYFARLTRSARVLYDSQIILTN